MLIYIHVPFCRTKCTYCAFHSRPIGQGGQARVHAYMQTLLQEIDWHAARLGPVPVETIFLGGGTPSLLPASAIALLLERLASAFTLPATAEITVEANPESALAPGWLAGVFAAGVNRLSFGVQSFDDAVLRVLGRVHTGAQAVQAVQAAHAKGFANVSLDLMWGLPAPPCHASILETWHTTLETAVALRPHHLSCYGLTLEPHTPLACLVARGQLAVPTETTQAALFLHTGDMLRQHGFARYEIANFATQGHECRHNLGYWQGTSYLGFGPAAASTVYEPCAGAGHTGGRKAVVGLCMGHVGVPHSMGRATAAPCGVRHVNPIGMAAWQRAVALGTLGTGQVGEYERLTPHIYLKERLMLALRTSRGLNLAAWHNMTGTPFATTFAGLVRALEKEGLAGLGSDYFSLTPHGMLLSSAVIQQFFDILEDTCR